MASARIGHDVEPVRSAALRWMAFAAIAGVTVLFVGSRPHDVVHQATAVGPVEGSGVSSAHCVQFIELAKAKFGADWKYRLDPRDKTCADSIQEQWQHEWNARLPIQPSLPPTAPFNSPETQPNSEAAASEVHIASPETYCLNVISLARSRYGADWASKVSPDEAARCGGAIRQSASQ